MQRYVNGTYLLDPVYTACAHGRPAGLYRMGSWRRTPSSKGNTSTRRTCTRASRWPRQPGREIVFLSPLPGGTYAAYSLMRCNGSPVFAEEEIAALRLCQPALEAFLQRHYARVAEASMGARAARSIAEHLAAAFSGFATDRLTAREQAIVGLILRGIRACPSRCTWRSPRAR